MFTKMLVATDLSEASERAIYALGSLKTIGTREALLIHCFNAHGMGTLTDLDCFNMDRLMELAKPPLERQQKILHALGFQVTAKMALGLPQVEINRQADEHNCSLVVVGSSGGTMAGEILLGGVASAVVHSATRPVLVLRLGLKAQAGRASGGDATCSPLEHILFPTDFSDNAEHAFSYVRKIAECGAKRITLLHVQDQGRIDHHLKDRLEEFNRIDTARLARLKEELIKAGVKDVRTELSHGSPKKEIIARIGRGDVSLVVMGSQGRGYLGDVFLGSVSHAVTRNSAVPVLLIPAIK